MGQKIKETARVLKRSPLLPLCWRISWFAAIILEIMTDMRWTTS